MRFSFIHNLKSIKFSGKVTVVLKEILKTGKVFNFSVKNLDALVFWNLHFLFQTFRILDGRCVIFAGFLYFFIIGWVFFEMITASEAQIWDILVFNLMNVFVSVLFFAFNMVLRYKIKIPIDYINHSLSIDRRHPHYLCWSKFVHKTRKNHYYNSYHNMAGKGIDILHVRLWNVIFCKFF